MTTTAPAQPTLEEIIELARSEGRDTLLETEAREIVRWLGLSLPKQLFFETSIESERAAMLAYSELPGSRIVLKIVASDIQHKSDVGGVRILEKRVPAIVAALDEMREALKDHDVRGFLFSEFIESDGDTGSELLLGVRWTPDFGAVVTFGAGGIATEFFAKNIQPGREIALFSPGLTRPEDIESILLEKAITPFVTGGIRRQRAKLSMEELRSLIVRFLEFARKFVPESISEFEINPLLPTAGGIFALDALVRLSGPSAEAAPPRPVEKIQRLLRPASVAVVGVSKALNPGHVIVNNLIKEGFEPGSIFIVKPGEESIEGCRCVADIASLPQTVDLLVLSIAAEQVPAAIEEAIVHRKAESIIVIPGGMGEHSGGKSLEEQIRKSLALSRSTDWRGPVVNGGNCLGIYSQPGKYDTIFLPDYKLQPRSETTAPLAFVSQSGAFAVSKANKLPFRSKYLVSIGNQIDLTVGDYLQFLENDEDVEAFAFYVEGFKPLDGRRWLEAAARVTASKRPVILYRAGRTAEGAKASASHTAAIAADAVVTRELATAAGVLVCNSLEEFEDLTKLAVLLRRRTFSGTRVAAMSNAGFESVALADNISGLQLATLGEESATRVREVIAASKLDRIVTIDNPLDVNPMLPDAAFAEVARALIDDPGVDLAVIGCVPLTGALETLPRSTAHKEDLENGDSIVSRLYDLWTTTRKPWAVVVDAGPLYDAMAESLECRGVPTFRTADRALSAMSRWAKWMERVEK